ncbi:MAG TPA: TlpA disulfide reductase family protein [Usitatibacter sp.]|nr:TlpA disulfide reductase family protein [Usitatibacter sp.]
MSARRLFTLVGILAVLAGTALWWVARPKPPETAMPAGEVTIAPAALLAASFVDADGRPQPLGRFEGKVLVLNFWATWCAPCRDEMPAFARLQSRWGARGVQFVGLSAESPELVARFGRDLAITYPLWTGGDAVGELSRRLGNERGVLPHTVVLGPRGEIRARKVGPYSEDELEAILVEISQKSG